MIRELAEKNRSDRGYDETVRLTKEELLDFVDCARVCASSVNLQPLKYFLAWEKETVDKIQAETHWAKALPELSLPHPGKCPTAFIVICDDKRIAPNPDRFRADEGIVAQTMLLRAVEMGYGGCMIGNFRPERLSAVLDLPEYIFPMLIVAFGKPDETVVLTEAQPGDDVHYYRDEDDVHYVPKRTVGELVLNG